MDKAKDEAINKLITGQEKMWEDICSLQIGQEKMGKDITELKVDVSELKQGQQHLETMMLRMIEEVTFVKKVVIKMENDLIPQVKTLFDADKVRHYDTTELKQVCREQDKKLDDHELRLTRLENN